MNTRFLDVILLLSWVTLFAACSPAASVDAEPGARASEAEVSAASADVPGTPPEPEESLPERDGQDRAAGDHAQITGDANGREDRPFTDTKAKTDDRSTTGEGGNEEAFSGRD